MSFAFSASGRALTAAFNFVAREARPGELIRHLEREVLHGDPRDFGPWSESWSFVRAVSRAAGWRAYGITGRPREWQRLQELVADVVGVRTT